MNKSQLFIGLLVLFLIGGGYIVYSQRPVMLNDYDSEQHESLTDELEEEFSELDEVSDEEDDSIESQAQAVLENQEAPLKKSEPAPAVVPPSEQKAEVTQEQKPKAEPAGPATFTMAQVSAHSTRTDCWTTIGGNVYDLTTFVDRHPGGPDRILGLCGTDGTEKFTKKHGESDKAKASLFLLKIGILK